MGRSLRVLSVLATGALVLVVGTPTAHGAILGKPRYQCQAAIAKEAGKYVNGKLKLITKCNDLRLAGGSCSAPDAAALQKLAAKLDAGLAKKCSFTPGTDDDNLAVIGFPGPCFDADASNGFTISDLQACIKNSHDRILQGVCDGGTNQDASCTVDGDCAGGGTCRSIERLVYDPSIAGPLSGTSLSCQKEVAKQSLKLVKTVLGSVQKCRNGLLNCKIDTKTDATICKLSGFAASTCATSDPKTKSTIDKARAKAIAAITAKCTDSDATALKLCEPDQTTGAGAATCEADGLQVFVDNPNAAELSDLIDYEYASPGTCGDNRKNRPAEECDGADDQACPGQCGAPLGLFPCLCLDVPRSRVVEHATADLDNGWTGQSHDSGIVEGGGYVSDLFDCDGPGGPDTICTVGPSCTNPPHSPCSPGPSEVKTGDQICATLGQGTCRMTQGGMQGPHCESPLTFKRRCRPDQNDCPDFGDRCVTTAHGAPLPIVSGGVAVCVVNVFTEDVVGTTNLATGESSVRLRQNSSTYSGGATQQPCPVCGGFCSGPGGIAGPNTRNLCSSNADCKPGSYCVTDNVCSWGPDMDKPCRPDTPFGGTTEYFGHPSVDCRMAGSLLGTIDVLFNPSTTAVATKTANIFCNTPGFNNKVCAGGANEHRPCTANSECPGGTCNDQCFCPNTQGEIGQKPNACFAACLGGANDAAPCNDDSECDPPNGFCHIGDCRPNPNDPDNPDYPNPPYTEGLCTVSPPTKVCSAHPFLTCADESFCRPPTCPYCDPNETCDLLPRQCFTNPTYTRVGVPGVPDRTTAATFCLTKTSSAAVNAVAGLSGPGGIKNPTTVTNTGF
ncbi:MAG: hypothetical protein OZ922_13340 [Myxococcales bacterium]|jgi:hypothetical protein|nr:hypothetical protein [Myxococcales bacterium]